MDIKKALVFSVCIRIFMLLLCLMLGFARLIESESQKTVSKEYDDACRAVVDAAKSGNNFNAAELIKKGYPTIGNQINGATILHMACDAASDNGGRTLLKTLLDHGADVNVVNQELETPLQRLLYVITKDGRLDRIGELLMHGAHMLTHDKRGYTLLDNMVYQMSVDAIHAFIFEWGFLYTVDAVHHAKKLANSLGLTFVADELAKGIPETFIVDRDGYANSTAMTPLMLWVIKGDMPRAAAVCNNHTVNQITRGRFALTALEIAIMHRQAGLVRFLLEHGARIEKRGGIGILCRIAGGGDIEQRKEIVDFLIQHGAKLNEADNDGNTLLHRLVIDNDILMVEYLISRYSSTLNIRLKNEFNKSPLDYAYAYNMPVMVKLLLSKS